MIKIILFTIIITTSSLLSIGYYAKEFLANSLGYISSVSLSKTISKITKVKTKAKSVKTKAKSGLVKKLGKRGAAVSSSHLPFIGGVIATATVMGLMIDDYCKNQEQFTNIINILDDKPEEKYNLEECVTVTTSYLKEETSNDVGEFINDAKEWVTKKYNYFKP